MQEIISKEEFNKLMSFKGEAKGTGLKSYAEFILKEEGERGLKRFEEALAKAGYLMKYQDIKPTYLYPVGEWILFLLVAKRLFNYDDKKFQEMGIFQVKVSTLIRFFMKYFVSIERASGALPKIWRQHFTIGDFSTVELNKEKKYIILKLENFVDYDPVECQLIIGVLIGSVQMILNSKVICEETKCSLRGDQHHEFILKW